MRCTVRCGRKKFSGYYLADEIRMTYRGMMIAIPKTNGWFSGDDPEELAEVLVDWRGRCPCRSTQKAPRSEEAEAEESEWGEDQACCNSEDSKSYEKRVQHDTFERAGSALPRLEDHLANFLREAIVLGGKCAGQRIGLEPFGRFPECFVPGGLAPSGFRWKSYSNMRSMSASA